MYCIEKTCYIVGTYRYSPVIRRSGLVPPLPPSLHFWCNTSRQSAQLWSSQGPECRTTSSNWESTATLVRPCVQNAPPKTVESSPAG